MFHVFNLSGSSNEIVSQPEDTPQEVETPPVGVEREPSRQRHRHHHHHHHHQGHHKHHHHRTASEKDLKGRRHLGSEFHVPDALRRVPTEEDEASMLADADLEDIASKSAWHHVYTENISMVCRFQNGR